MNVVENQIRRYERLARAYRRLSFRIGEKAIHLYGSTAVRSAYCSAVADLYEARAALAFLEQSGNSSSQRGPFIAWHRLAISTMTSLWRELGSMRCSINTSTPDDTDSSDLVPLKEFTNGVLLLIDLDALRSEIAPKEVE